MVLRPRRFRPPVWLELVAGGAGALAATFAEELEALFFLLLFTATFTLEVLTALEEFDALFFLVLFAATFAEELLF